MPVTISHEKHRYFCDGDTVYTDIESALGHPVSSLSRPRSSGRLFKSTRKQDTSILTLMCGHWWRHSSTFGLRSEIPWWRRFGKEGLFIEGFQITCVVAHFSQVENSLNLSILRGNARRVDGRGLFGERYPSKNRTNHDDDDGAQGKVKNYVMMMMTAHNVRMKTRHDGDVDQSQNWKVELRRGM